MSLLSDNITYWKSISFFYLHFEKKKYFFELHLTFYFHLFHIFIIIYNTFLSILFYLYFCLPWHSYSLYTSAIFFSNKIQIHLIRYKNVNKGKRLHSFQIQAHIICICFLLWIAHTHLLLEKLKFRLCYW